MPNSYSFLLAYQHLFRDTSIYPLIESTLDHLSWGGIYDQLGGGFSRYSVDIFWKVPHFEKMLYDNAQLVSLYSQAYRHSPKADYERVIRQTLEFMKREMTSPEGGFYSSQEIKKALGEEALSKLFVDFYQISTAGNWEKGKNVLIAQGSIDAYAAKKGLDKAKLEQDLARARKTLFDLTG